MNAKQLMNILNQLKDPEHRQMFVHVESKDKEFPIESVSEFGISSDIIIHLEKDAAPIGRSVSVYELDNLPEDAKKHLLKVKKQIKKDKQRHSRLD